jgi:hypothetical protein
VELRAASPFAPRLSGSGARAIPAEYRIRCEHQLGFLFVASISF